MISNIHSGEERVADGLKYFNMLFEGSFNK